MLLPTICLGISVLVGNGAQAEQHWYPISLICPAENEQVLERVEQNSSGDQRFIRVRYADNVAALVTVSGRVKGTYKTKTYLDVDIRTETRPPYRRIGEGVARESNALKAICEGPPEKRLEYFDSLKANKRLLGLP